MKKSIVLYVPSLYPARGKMVFPQHCIGDQRATGCINDREMKSESGFSLTIATQPLKSSYERLPFLIFQWNLNVALRRMSKMKKKMRTNEQLSSLSQLFNLTFESSPWRPAGTHSGRTASKEQVHEKEEIPR